MRNPRRALWAELDAGWCRSHHTRWRQRGRPPTAEFITHCASYGEDRFDFRPLPPQLRLEIGYALQCRVDANRTRTTPRSIKPLLDHLAASGAQSLLERRLADWLTGRHCQVEQSEGDFRRFASAIHQVACDV